MKYQGSNSSLPHVKHALNIQPSVALKGDLSREQFSNDICILLRKSISIYYIVGIFFPLLSIVVINLFILADC